MPNEQDIAMAAMVGATHDKAAELIAQYREDSVALAVRTPALLSTQRRALVAACEHFDDAGTYELSAALAELLARDEVIGEPAEETDGTYRDGYSDGFARGIEYGRALVLLDKATTRSGS